MVSAKFPRSAMFKGVNGPSYARPHRKLKTGAMDKPSRRKAILREQQRRERKNHIMKGLADRNAPISYYPSLARRICERYADGEPMLSILATPSYPSGGQFYLWVESVPALEELWQAARKARAHSLAEETIPIADQSLKGHPAYIPAHALRVRTRQWMSAKLRPEIYGEQVNHQHQGLISLVAASAALKEVNPPVLTLDNKPIDKPSRSRTVTVDFSKTHEPAPPTAK